MTSRITNALRIISIIVLAIVFFIAYAGLPEQVLLFVDKSGNPTHYISKNYFFYGSLALLIASNTLFYVLASILKKSENHINQLLSNYMLSLVIIINVFFATSFSFIGILNGQENFDYTSFAPFIYLSFGLFVIWLFAFLFSLIKIKKTV